MSDLTPEALSGVDTVPELARLLRQLRRRHARRCGHAELTYRDLAAATGWSLSAVGEYFAGDTLPPTDRFDALIRLLGAEPEEQGALATVRDRVDEHRRRVPAPAGPAGDARRRRAPVAARPAGTAAAGRPVPRQLPADVPGFTGRDAQLHELDLLMAGAERASTLVVPAVSGTAGVGKTALAVHWAHRVRGRFPDGQLYVNLRGFDPAGRAVSPAEAVRGFLDALGVAPQHVPAGLDPQTALYRSLVADRRMLILLDNARDADQVRPLLPGAAGCLVVVTSRDLLSGLVVSEGAHPLVLDLLTTDEARRLLERRLGAARVAAEPEAVDDIVGACARLPLALAIVAARAVARPAFPLSGLADALRQARGGLDVFTHGDPATDVRAVFSWSYHTLRAPAARLFRLLGVHPGPDITIPAAASLAGVPPREATAAVGELTRANLLTEHTAGRFTFHDLLRAYATELAHDAEPEAERRAAAQRALDHYLRTAYAADQLLNPERDPITLPPAGPGVTPEEHTDRGQAMAWFGAEHRVLLAAADRAAAAGLDVHAWQLPWVLADFFNLRGHGQDLATTQHTALEAARRLADRQAQAHIHRTLARACAWRGGYEEAHLHLDQALGLYAELGDQIGLAHIHLNIGSVLGRQGRHREALEHAQRAHALYRATGRDAWRARALDAVGWLYAQLGEYHQALAYCRQALALHQEVGDRHGEAEAWDSLGYAHHHLGGHDQATVCYERAIGLYRGLGDRFNEATTLSNLGDARVDARDPQAARTAWQQAVDILDELGHPDAGAVRAKLNVDAMTGRSGQLRGSAKP
ncbi:MAG TPA: tetratricopeptide repeat protein [Micromonosporaceae bacterium]|nr:tetratricopeptide repeat protein [Micromonosporaceae bacterium]